MSDLRKTCDIGKQRERNLNSGGRAGGYLAANSGAAGAAIGSMILPGLGTIAGGIIGILAGAAAGGTTGHVIGKMVDEDIIRNYRCDSCGYIWKG